MASQNVTLYAVWLEDAAPAAPTISVGSAAGRAGASVVVPISVANNPGIASAGIVVNYDVNKLSLTNAIEVDAAFPIDSLHVTDTGTQVLSLGTGTSDYNKNGAIVKLTFAIREETSIGDTEVCVSFREYPDGKPTNTLNETFDNFVLRDGVVTVVNFIYGDLNGDGKLAQADLNLMRQYFAGWSVTLGPQ
jgi:hypothetical protein